MDEIGCGGEECNLWDMPLSAGMCLDEIGDKREGSDESGEAGKDLDDIGDTDPPVLADWVTHEELDESEWGSSSRQGAAAQPPPAERVVDRSEPSAQIACQIRAFTHPIMKEDMIVAYLAKLHKLLSKTVRNIRSSKWRADVSHHPPERPRKKNLTQHPPRETVLEIYNLVHPEGCKRTKFFTYISVKYSVSLNQVRNIRNGTRYTHITQHPRTTAVTQSTAVTESTVPLKEIIDTTAMRTIFQAKLDVLALHKGVYDKTDMKLKCHELMDIYGCNAVRIYDIWQGRVGVNYTQPVWDPALIETVSKRTAALALKKQAADTASSGPT